MLLIFLKGVLYLIASYFENLQRHVFRLLPDEKIDIIGCYLKDLRGCWGGGEVRNMCSLPSLLHFHSKYNL